AGVWITTNFLKKDEILFHYLALAVYYEQIHKDDASWTHAYTGVVFFTEIIFINHIETSVKKAAQLHWSLYADNLRICDILQVDRFYAAIVVKVGIGVLVLEGNSQCLLGIDASGEDIIV
ncbi:hypothetical protein ACJX0J_031201, partial [Zea mays]